MKIILSDHSSGSDDASIRTTSDNSINSNTTTTTTTCSNNDNNSSNNQLYERIGNTNNRNNNQNYDRSERSQSIGRFQSRNDHRNDDRHDNDQRKEQPYTNKRNSTNHQNNRNRSVDHKKMSQSLDLTVSGGGNITFAHSQLKNKDQHSYYSGKGNKQRDRGTNESKNNSTNYKNAKFRSKEQNQWHNNNKISEFSFRLNECDEGICMRTATRAYNTQQLLERDVEVAQCLGKGYTSVYLSFFYFKFPCFFSSFSYL